MTALPAHLGCPPVFLFSVRATILVMEPEQPVEVETQSQFAPQTTEEIVNERLNTVTPVSKYLALALFIILPFVGGWIGYQYAPAKVVEIEKYQENEVIDTAVFNEAISGETELAEVATVDYAIEPVDMYDLSVGDNIGGFVIDSIEIDPRGYPNSENDNNIFVTFSGMAEMTGVLWGRGMGCELSIQLDEESQALLPRLVQHTSRPATGFCLDNSGTLVSEIGADKLANSEEVTIVIDEFTLRHYPAGGGHSANFVQFVAIVPLRGDNLLETDLTDYSGVYSSLIQQENVIWLMHPQPSGNLNLLINNPESNNTFSTDLQYFQLADIGDEKLYVTFTNCGGSMCSDLVAMFIGNDAEGYRILSKHSDMVIVDGNYGYQLNKNVTVDDQFEVVAYKLPDTISIENKLFLIPDPWENNERRDAFKFFSKLISHSSGAEVIDLISDTEFGPVYYIQGTGISRNNDLYALRLPGGMVKVLRLVE